MAEADVNHLAGSEKEESPEITGKEAGSVPPAVEETEDLQSEQLQRQPMDLPKLSQPYRPHPSLISEFDPFASSHNIGPEKPAPSSEPKTPLTSKATSQARQLVPSLDVKETPSGPVDSANVTLAPRKQVQKQQHHIGTESESASPSTARQPQTRTSVSRRAEQQHQHAGSLLMEGESRTNTKPKEMAFDFQGFLSQLRTRPAEPIQKYLKR